MIYATNVEHLRSLLLDWQAIQNDGGPGATNDGKGTWHLFCHLAAGAALYRLADGHVAWIGILYDNDVRQYVASLCVDLGGTCSTTPLKSQAALGLISNGEWRGYLEGASRGRILDRNANDGGDPATTDRRQDYDRDALSPEDGGPVWEMWTVSRDIRPSNHLGTSLITAYSQLLQVVGGRFAAVVARGRMEPEYGHLRQMCAMIDAGIITADDALFDIDTVSIPPDVERSLLTAHPHAFARAASQLEQFHRQPCYFMYDRKRSSFAPASLLRRLSVTLAPAARSSEVSSTEL